MMGKVASQGSPGVESLRWLRPVRPGDALSLRYTLVEKVPSESKPALRGRVRLHYALRNQRDEMVMTLDCWGIIGRRQP